eukprot:9379135-Pyramimonas_sp.AAC.1
MHRQGSAHAGPVVSINGHRLICTVIVPPSPDLWPCPFCHSASRARLSPAASYQHPPVMGLSSPLLYLSRLRIAPDRAPRVEQ